MLVSFPYYLFYLRVKYNSPRLFKNSFAHFRKPEVYEGRVVLLLGAFLSGLDISVDLAPFVKKVLSFNLM